jgi:hypothetical protein
VPWGVNMDFNQLMARMRELDQPTQEGCGDAMPSMPTMNNEPPVPPPSMSVNLNASGMDNIESLLKLMTKVNPDMMPKDPMPMPTLSAPPSIMSIKPQEPPMKMLPDLSDEPHDEPDGDEGPVVKLDLDKKDEDGGFRSATTEPDEKYMDIDAAIPDGNDLNKPKGTHPKVAGGDNPIQKMESGDLRAQIRAELLQRLEESKSKK